jgi:hypothetical protein
MIYIYKYVYTYGTVDFLGSMIWGFRCHNNILCSWSAGLDRRACAVPKISFDPDLALRKLGIGWFSAPAYLHFSGLPTEQFQHLSIFSCADGGKPLDSGMPYRWTNPVCWGKRVKHHILVSLIVVQTRPEKCCLQGKNKDKEPVTWHR